MLNLFFLLVYALGSGFFGGTDLMILLTIHFGICIVNHLRQKQITPIFIFYVGVIIVNVANMDLISQVAARNIHTYGYIVPRYIDQAALIWCVSSTLCAVGYDLAIKRSLPSISFELRRESVLQTLFWVLLCANLLTVIGYGTSLKGNQLAKIFSLLNSVGILFFARLWGKEGSKTFRMYAICLFLIETYVALISSYLRFELILPTFYLTVGYFVGKGDIKYIFSYRILPVLGILLFYSSVFSALQRNRSNFISIFTEESQVDETNESPSGGLMDRSANLAQITNVVNLVEKNGFYNGAASAPILTALIPRVLWPDKPLIQLGAWFALEIGVGSKTDYGISNNSVNMTVAGELYLDFGWLGVILGSLFFGAFLAVLWNSTHFYRSEYNITGTIFGGYLFILSLGSYADLQIVITLLSTYIVFYFVKRISSHYEDTDYRPAVERK